VVATEPREQEVREELETILASPVFRNSKRYASVLKYIVERTLEGGADHLKERTIGIEIFGRTPDYDTASDHVVRSAMAEIRKRLAQYYHEFGQESALRIEISSGSYIPQFRHMADKPHLAPLEQGTELIPPSPAGKRSFRYWLWRVALSLAVLAAFVSVLSLMKPEDPMEVFWGPVLGSRGEVLLCVGNLEGGRTPTVDPLAPNPPVTLADFHRTDTEIVHVNDAMTLARIAGFIQARSKPYHIASQTEATFTDLQDGPAVLIGLMNNDWTERLVNNLRFTVERSGPSVVMIRDHQNPKMSDWSTDYSVPYLDVTKDYALVLRVSDPKTEQMVVTVAGISAFGTLAAGEFLTNPRDMQKLAALAPATWKQKNLEIVLSTEVIRGKPGRAKIVATYFW
jgi:hypothetical protein